MISFKMTDDVFRFATLATKSRDLDPAYPVLKAIQEEQRQHPSYQAWASVCFVAWYRMASSLQVPPGRIGMPPTRTWSLGTGVERRSLRTPERMRRHFQSMLDLTEAHGSLEAWLGHGFGDDPKANWRHLRMNFEQAWGNGRWASYKLAEVLKEVNGWPLVPPDMGHDGSTGPVEGINLLYGPPRMSDRADKTARLAYYDAAGADLALALFNKGLPLNLAQVETVLCDFHSLANGTYYVGHDIDLMLSDIRRPEVPGIVADSVLRARKKTIPHAYLGELRGWLGVDAPRRRVYATTGRILSR